MARSDDWAFDVVDHVLTHYAEKIRFTPDERQNYPDRVTGTVTEAINDQDFRAVIIPKPVGHDNAVRYRRWVTLPPVHWANLTERPVGWRYFVLMVGLLPDGQPWWSSLYEERTLAEGRMHSENMGGWYRFDPGLTQKALIADWDKDRPAADQSQVPFRFSLTDKGETLETTDPEEFVEAIRAVAELADEGPNTGRVDIGPGQMSLHFE